MVSDDQFPTFDGESKSAKILNSHYGGRGRGLVMANFQKSISNFLSPILS